MVSPINSILHHMSYERECDYLKKATKRQLLSRTSAYKSVINTIKDKRHFLLKVFPNIAENQMLDTLGQMVNIDDEVILRETVLAFACEYKFYLWSSYTSKL